MKGRGISETTYEGLLAKIILRRSVKGKWLPLITIGLGKTTFLLSMGISVKNNTLTFLFHLEPPTTPPKKYYNKN